MRTGANGIYQNSIYGIVANLPMKYTNAVVLGCVSIASVACCLICCIGQCV